MKLSHPSAILSAHIKAGKCQFHAFEIVACYVRGSGGIVDEYRNME